MVNICGGYGLYGISIRIPFIFILTIGYGPFGKFFLGLLYPNRNASDDYRWFIPKKIAIKMTTGGIFLYK